VLTNLRHSRPVGILRYHAYEHTHILCPQCGAMVVRQPPVPLDGPWGWNHRRIDFAEWR